MRITIYGTGYVGLVTGTCLAELGHKVLCIDIDQNKINQLNAGKVPIYEPGLVELIKKNTTAGRLKFDHSLATGIHFSEIQMITVNTPTQPKIGSDISNILSVADSIATTMEGYKLIINKSTAPPGTASKIEQLIIKRLKELNKNCSFDIAANPEFLKEGNAIKDFMQPDRILIGIKSERCRPYFKDLYQGYDEKLIYTDLASAELSKYAANALLATKISFMNEMSLIAEKTGADIEEVKKAIGLDPRIGPHFINPGCGYGGSCFPKDVQALVLLAESFAITPRILNAVEAVNQNQKQLLAHKILSYFKNQLKGKCIAIWGLAFKPNTDDMREASSIEIMKQLWKHGALIKAYDPIACPEAKKIFAQEIDNGQLVLCDSKESALEDTHALAIITEWDEFKNAELEILKSRIIFDGRNLFEPSAMREASIQYFSIGR